MVRAKEGRRVKEAEGRPIAKVICGFCGKEAEGYWFKFTAGGELFFNVVNHLCGEGMFMESAVYLINEVIGLSQKERILIELSF